MREISNEEKAREIANKDRTIELLMPCKPSYYDGLLQGAMEMAQWKDQQLADYLQREWDRCAGACSAIVSAHCRDVERMANDLGIKLKFNNPYIE